MDSINFKDISPLHWGLCIRRVTRMRRIEKRGIGDGSEDDGKADL